MLKEESWNQRLADKRTSIVPEFHERHTQHVRALHLYKCAPRVMRQTLSGCFFTLHAHCRAGWPAQGCKAGASLIRAPLHVHKGKLACAWAYAWWVCQDLYPQLLWWPIFPLGRKLGKVMIQALHVQPLPLPRCQLQETRSGVEPCVIRVACIATAASHEEILNALDFHAKRYACIHAHARACTTHVHVCA